MTGVVRWGGQHFLFVERGGREWGLHVPGRYWDDPKFLNEVALFEGFHIRSGWLVLYRLLPLGYDVPPPFLIGWRMLLGFG